MATAMPTPHPRRSEAARAASLDGPLLVYAVLAAGAGPWEAPRAGVAGRTLRRVVAGGLAAVVSRLGSGDETPDVTRALEYAAVVDALHAAGTIVPMRYGCVVAGAAALATLLQQRGAEYRRLLATVDGCAEMAVRLALPGAPAPKPPNGNGHDAHGAGPGEAYLRRRQAVFAAADREQHLLGVAEDELRAAVVDLVVAMRPERCRGRTPAGLPERALAFLVRRGNVEAFRAAVVRLRRQSGARLRVSGPWPPYTFVTAERPALTR